MQWQPDGFTDCERHICKNRKQISAAELQILLDEKSTDALQKLAEALNDGNSAILDRSCIAEH